MFPPAPDLFAPPTSPDTPPRTSSAARPPTATASIEARTVVTWAGAALLLAGALAFATVIWRQAGESGRLAILAAVTLLAFAGADRLRRMTPTTAEAFSAIAAGMVVVDAVSAHHGGYAFGWRLTAWFAVTLLPAGLAFLALGRYWRSSAAAVSAGILLGLGSASLAFSLTLDSTWLSDRALATALVALATTGLGVLTSRLTDQATRGALLAAAWSAWVVQALLALGEAVASFVGFGLDGGSSATSIQLAASFGLLAGLPLVIGVRGPGRAWAAGVAAGLVWSLSATLTQHAIRSMDPADNTALVWRVLCVWALVLAPTLVAWLALGGTNPAARSPLSLKRASTFSFVTATTYVLATITVVSGLNQERGPLVAASVLIAIAVAPVVPLSVLGRRLPTELTVALTSVPLAGLVAALGLAAQTFAHGRPGDVVAMAAAALAAASFLPVPVTTRVAMRWIAGAALLSAPLAGLTSAEAWSIPAAVVAAAGAAVAWQRDERSSWLLEAPASALLLMPSLAAGLDGHHTSLRLSFVATAAALLLVDSTRRRRQGPAVVAVASIASVVAWVVVPRIGHVPSWQLLTLSGALLLWVGFTWERRRDAARHVAHAWTTWA